MGEKLHKMTVASQDLSAVLSDKVKPQQDQLFTSDKFFCDETFSGLRDNFSVHGYV
jgi:hypothetical protein